MVEITVRSLSLLNCQAEKGNNYLKPSAQERRKRRSGRLQLQLGSSDPTQSRLSTPIFLFSPEGVAARSPSQRNCKREAAAAGRRAAKAPAEPPPAEGERGRSPALKTRVFAQRDRRRSPTAEEKSQGRARHPGEHARRPRGDLALPAPRRSASAWRDAQRMGKPASPGARARERQSVSRPPNRKRRRHARRAA